MVKGSSLREKLRSSALKDLARERAAKRARVEVEQQEDKGKDENRGNNDTDDEEDREQARINQERLLAKARSAECNLLSILPKPQNGSLFGPTVKLDKLLKMPERAEEVSEETNVVSNSGEGITDDGMVEVNVSRIVGDYSQQSLVRELTVEKSKPAVIIPKGKEKQKNQITYLAQLGKATELERKEQASQSRLNKAAARSKYGW